jgi:hypothetical protein
MISRTCHLHNNWSWKFPQGVNPVLRPTPSNCCVLSFQTLITDCLISAHLFLPKNSKRFWRLDFIVIVAKTLQLTKKYRFPAITTEVMAKLIEQIIKKLSIAPLLALA